jgi:hypothetical protein
MQCGYYLNVSVTPRRSTAYIFIETGLSAGGNIGYSISAKKSNVMKINIEAKLATMKRVWLWL